MSDRRGGSRSGGSDREEPPARCPECGARDSFRKRYATGGGWRGEYRCAECGRRWTPD
ncbi:hypothetical protein [Salinirubrum litoreum]|uniref:Small CPxCG-related zinc finger protein n=1 Tax=Salinirubrum litoreum TaxID=1126234 RepID=A0ABD5R8L4_9EURY|nr:hypothetical protein [Salinirubrum litoreum]